MNNKEILLDVISIKKVYQSKKGKDFTAVNNISFRVNSGECFGLLGPNGAGKSTSMNCITGFYPLTEGQILIRGINVHQEPKKARQYLGVCSQDNTLDTDFTVFEQMISYATYFGINKKTAESRAEQLLKRFGLSDKAANNVEELSGGMQRRLQVARAFISEPSLIILDEPTTGLDPEVRRELWEIISESREKGLGILLSTHYMEEAERLCDRIAVIDQGKILACDSPRELIKKFIGTEMIEEELRPGLKWQRPPNLEDVYLKLAGRNL